MWRTRRLLRAVAACIFFTFLEVPLYRRQNSPQVFCVFLASSVCTGSMRAIVAYLVLFAAVTAVHGQEACEDTSHIKHVSNSSRFWHE